MCFSNFPCFELYDTLSLLLRFVEFIAPDLYLSLQQFILIFEVEDLPLKLKFRSFHLSFSHLLANSLVVLLQLF